jgi:heme/copper-type cytochrome/quinol oxidase subunit 3
MSEHAALDVRHLPRFAFGTKSILWWGTMGLVVIEGTMFAILLATYYYLRTRSTDWPPGVADPYLAWGVVNTAIFLVSELPNLWLKKSASAMDLRKVRTGLVIVDAFGLAALLVRIFEFPALHSAWSLNAYTSVVWMLLGFHTMHLLTDWADSIVLTVLLFTGPVERKRFVDVSENADYWTFVVLAWLPIFFTIYFAPRLF